MNTLYDTMLQTFADGLNIGSDNRHYQSITTDDQLLDFVYQTWGVYIPRTQVCEHHTTPAAAFCDAYFARTPVAIWKASRGFGGKSFLLALLSLTEAVTLNTSVNILGGSGEQSRRVLEYFTSFWNYANAPRELLAKSGSQHKMQLASGVNVQALRASQTSVRGAHVARLRLDEIDEMKQELLDAAQGQTMTMNNVPMQTVMSSTQQYADGTMATMLQRSVSKDWKVFQWC